MGISKGVKRPIEGESLPALLVEGADAARRLVQFLLLPLLPFYEGESLPALLVEGATRAPLNDCKEGLWNGNRR
jgi:hypothetical protein